LLSLDPSSLSSKIHNLTLLPTWVKGGANATLFLHSMSKPRHGTLQLSLDNTWSFVPGKGATTSGIPLLDLPANCQELVDTGQLFRSHAKFKNVYDTRSQLSLRDCVLHHVSAHGLKSLVIPSSLKAHHKLDSGDKQIWDSAYNEEFDGLTSLPSWEVMTEEQYQKLSHSRKALPTMAIVTIKYDEHNKPKRAKYCIVVLGNLDYHHWSKADTAAPVLSQLELRLLTSLAVHHRRVLKNCDVKQAFVQSSLPEDEVYFLKPPVGCPRSRPNEYWHLIRSLYGLKRAPKLWFETLCAHLRSMGLQNSKNSPCLFVGHLIEGGGSY